MISLENINLLFDRTRNGEKKSDTIKVFEDYSLSIKENGIYLVLGDSGCGKTTLLNLIAGLIKPQSGKIRIDGGKIAYMFQEERLMDWLTLEENVNVVLSDTPKTLDTARKYLGLTGLAEYADLYPSEASGGMRSRTALARTLAFGGDTVLLDEPLGGIENEMKETLCRLIKDECEGKTVLIVTHDNDIVSFFGNGNNIIRL